MMQPPPPPPPPSRDVGPAGVVAATAAADGVDAQLGDADGDGAPFALHVAAEHGTVAVSAEAADINDDGDEDCSS